MDLSDYASKLAVKGLYILANTFLDILIALMKRFEKHLEHLEKYGEKTYLKRGIHKVQSFIKRREVTKLNLEIAETKFEIKGLDKELNKCNNIIAAYELQKEKIDLQSKINSSEELINGINNKAKDIELNDDKINNIKNIKSGIDKYKERLGEIETELDKTGIIKPISNDKYQKAKVDKSEISIKRENKQEQLENCLERKAEIKVEIEALNSIKLVHESKDLNVRKKELQEELDVVNRKIKNKDIIAVKEDKDSVKEDEAAEVEQEAQIIEIKDIKEESKPKNEKEVKDTKKSANIDEEKKDKAIEITTSKVVKITSIEQGMQKIKNAYREMKLLAIDNPKLVDDPKYKEKLKQAETLIKKYDLIPENERKHEKTKVKEVAR